MDIGPVSTRQEELDHAPPLYLLAMITLVKTTGKIVHECRLLASRMPFVSLKNAVC